MFDENQFYDSYDKDDLLKKTKKTDFVEFCALNPKPSYTPIDSDDEEWLKIFIKERSFNASDQASSDEKMREKKSSHFHAIKSTPASTSKKSKKSSTSIQLHTSDKTPARILERPLFKYTDDDRSSFSIRASALSESYENVTQRHKKSSKRFVIDFVLRSENDFIELLEISQTRLEITNFWPKRGVLSTDLNEFNVIQKRRTRRSNIRYADLVYVA